MTSSNGESGVLRSGAALWEHLVNSAGVATASWDEDLADEIAVALGLPIRKHNLTFALESAKVTAEDLLVAVFATLGPYAAMLEELFALFERWRVTRADDAAEIEFDFDKSREPVRFDYRSFKAAIEQITTVTRRRSSWRGPYWDLSRALQDLVPRADEAIATNTESSWLVESRKWLETWETGAEWPPVIRSPSAPSEAASVIDRLWEIWSSHLSLVRDVGLRPAEFRSMDAVVAGEALEAAQVLERDHWAANVVRNMAPVIRAIEAGQLAPSAVADSLSKVLEQFERLDSDDIERVRNIEDVLRLPLWRQRSGLFSAWTLCPIVATFGECVTLLPEGNRLSFTFRRRKIAEVNSHPTLEIWAELRSELLVPSAGDRKKGVQPDYSIIKEGNAPEAFRSVAEVECKQYWSSDRREFVAALHDYAGSRPNARVFLVNHGPVSGSILSAAHLAPYLGRIATLSEFAPGNERAVTALQSDLMRIASEHASWVSTTNADQVEARLTWANESADECLHLSMFDSPLLAGEPSDECTARATPTRRGCRAQRIEGKGETVSIDQWNAIAYALDVHRLHRDEPWPADMYLEIDWAGMTHRTEVPPPTDARWNGVFLRIAEFRREDQTTVATLWPNPRLTH